MSEELKPCPFCGGEAQRCTIEEPGDNFGGDVISCTRCMASSHVEFGRKENIVSCWNTRAPPPEDMVEAFWQALLERRCGHDPDKPRLILVGRADVAAAVEAIQSRTPAPLPTASEEVVEALRPFAEAAREFRIAVGPDGTDDGLTVLAHIHVYPEREVTLCTSHFSRARAVIQALSSLPVPDA